MKATFTLSLSLSPYVRMHLTVVKLRVDREINYCFRQNFQLLIYLTKSRRIENA
jgi:hypothetical protein